MSILTNFLKLVKPEKNDYVDVEEHISNNLDKIDEKMENFNLNKLDKGGYTGTAQNLLTEISKIASKTVLGRMIVGKGLTVDSSGRTSVVSKNDGIIVNDNDIQLNVYDGVDSTSTTRAGSARAVKQANDNANGRVSKNGDEMTGALKVPAVKGLQLGSNYIWYGEEYSTILSNESGYSLFWRNSLKEGKSAEFIGITNDSKIVFRKDAGTGDKKWRDYEILHYGNFSPVNDLITGGTSVPLSAEMGKKLNTDKQNKTDSKLGTTDKNIVGAINESLWHILAKSMSNDYTKISDEKELGDFWSHQNFKPTDAPKTIDYTDVRSSFFYFNNMSFHNNAKGFNMLQEVTTVDGVRFIRSIGWTGEPTPWRETLTDKSKLFTGQLGVNSIIYIQDTGAKTRGNGYVDKTTGKLYMCKPTDDSVNSVDDITVTENFVLATNLENTKRINDVIYGQCRAFYGGNPVTPGTGGDILNFGRKIKYASAIHSGTDPSVSIIIDFAKSNLDSGIIAFKSSAGSKTVVKYTIVFE